jgi:hypothetical protein
MGCKNCSSKTVWEFTNQTKLCKKCFLDYIERKVFRTIRKYDMLTSPIRLKKDNSINYTVLKHILEKKFEVVFGNTSVSENLSDVAEDAFENILEGKFEGKKPKDKVSRPLYFVSDKEIELYAKLSGLKGKEKKRDKRIQELFNRFMKKNPDLEINVVRALGQL